MPPSAGPRIPDTCCTSSQSQGWGNGKKEALAHPALLLGAPRVSLRMHKARLCQQPRAPAAPPEVEPGPGGSHRPPSCPGPLQRGNGLKRATRVVGDSDPGLTIIRGHRSEQAAWPPTPRTRATEKPTARSCGVYTCRGLRLSPKRSETLPSALTQGS